MSGLAKAFVVINLILALFFLGASATLFKANKNWKQVAEEGHQELGQLKERAEAKAKTDAGRIASLEENGSVQEAEIAVLTTQKQELENANGALNTDKSQLQARVNTLEAQIAQKDTHLQDRDNTLAAKDEEIARLIAEKTEADESRKVAVDLSQRARLDLQQQEEANEHLLKEITDIRGALDEKTLRLEALAMIGLPVDTIPVAVPKISGIVSAVRGDIVVLSVGRQDNVREGYEFTIYEGDRFIGKVKVESLLDDMSGARVLFTEQGATIKAGQNASTRLAG